MVGPFGLVFGVVAADAGFDVLQALGFSVAVIAGAAQLTAVQRITEGAPLVVVVVTALAVNLRMAMYSASLAPHLGRAPVRQQALIAYLMVDQAHAQSILHCNRNPQMALPERVACYVSAVSPIFPAWYLMTVIGAVPGNRIPPTPCGCWPPRSPSPPGFGPAP